jgi:DEAD/DEAH box helicase domain-containing protein
MKKISDLHGKNIVVFDLEIKEEIGGIITWNDHDKMGISVGCLFDYQTGDTHAYMDDNIKELTDRLNRADLIVAFNQIGFDNSLMRASGQGLKSDSELPNYDILIEGRKAIGWSESLPYPKGCKLDDFLKHTFGQQFMKTGSGALAPVLYKSGQLGKLVSYCLADVRRERMLFEHIYLTGEAKTENRIHKFSAPWPK